MTGRTRIITRAGAQYIVAEELEQIEGRMARATEWVALTNVPAQTAFPPERMMLRVDEISSMQTVSEEIWIWQQQVEQLRYAEALAGSPQQKIAEAQESLARWLAEQQEDVE